MDWMQRAVDHGAGIVVRVLTEQYLKTMKSIGFEAVHLPSTAKTPEANWRVYCHKTMCVVDADADGFYMLHTEGCPFYEKPGKPSASEVMGIPPAKPSYVLDLSWLHRDPK